MSGVTSTVLDAAAVTAAATLAIRAPSIHNTQPWRWELRGGVLAPMADRSRQLAVSDPDGHSLLISCGAAVALTEIGLRAQGWTVEVSLLPAPTDPDLLAEFRGRSRGAPGQLDVDRARAGELRRSERRPFTSGQLSEEQIDGLRRVGAATGVFTHFPVRAEENLNLAVAVTHADRFERHDADYLAEMARWVHPGNGRADGVPATVIPHVPEADPRHTNVPLRNFEVGVPGAQLIKPDIDEQPLLGVVFTDEDRPADRLRAGEAMMRVMIEAEMAGLSTCSLSQAVDMMAFRVRLRALMGWTQYPQMMLRLGKPPGGTPAPLTRRRALSDVLQVIS